MRIIAPRFARRLGPPGQPFRDKADFNEVHAKCLMCIFLLFRAETHQFFAHTQFKKNCLDRQWIVDPHAGTSDIKGSRYGTELRH